MKNKLFLTSMVAVMLAFPAYADLPYGHGIDSNGDGYIGSQTSTTNPAPINSADCDSDPLTYQGASENYGTYTLTAQWDVDQCTIELDPNVANGGASSNANPFATLYTTYNVGAYKDSARTNLMSTNSNGLLSAPIGKTVTLTANTNNPNSTNDITVSGGTLSGQLPFNGFFSAATGGTQYISQTSPYYILSAGDTAAKGVNTNGTGRCPDTTWYAQYGCFQTTLPTASKPGYTFDGWWTTADNAGVQLNDGDAALCLTADDTVYAHWSGNKHSIIYQAGSTGCSGSNYIDNSTKPTVGNNLTYALLGLSDTGITENPGYHFVEWGEDTLTSASYAPGDSYTATPWSHDGDLMFTAKCAPNNYTITYNCNGGTLNSNLVDSVDANGYGIDNVVYDTTSYTFQHQADLCTYANQTPGEFTCTHNADGTPWFAAQIWDIPDNVTCTANWDATPYTITYDCGSLPNNGGTVNGGTFENGTNNVDTPVYNGQNYSIKQNANGCGSTGQLDGYHFTGWECSPNLATGSSTAVYSVNSPASHPENVVQTISLGISGNATCVAQWKANEVNLKYLGNEGDTTPYSTDSCQYGADTFVLPVNPSKTGYTFTGWLVTDWDE